MFYELPSGWASFDGRTDGIGTKEFSVPQNRSRLEGALQEALILLAKYKEEEESNET